MTAGPHSEAGENVFLLTQCDHLPTDGAAISGHCLAADLQEPIPPPTKFKTTLLWFAVRCAGPAASERADGEGEGIPPATHKEKKRFPDFGAQENRGPRAGPTKSSPSEAGWGGDS